VVLIVNDVVWRTEMETDACFVLSATDVAVTVALQLELNDDGAVNVADVFVWFDKFPQPLVGEMLHVTPWFEESLVTVALR
jgi:hypothetical protein